ncbi:MAG TPA: hypothetical protein VGQ53_14175 [Chitinophagaceae bacterium]|jgi:hypothetical protein|nr:hypothetical protein [Chitinophagaceae bacterium]
MFYTRLFKLTRPKFIPPDKIDEDFYNEIKDRLKTEPDFAFESDIRFWETYKYITIVFIVFLISLSTLFVLSGPGEDKYPFFYGPAVFLVIILFFPVRYFIVLMVYLAIYFKNERKFHAHFKRVLAGSDNFPNFIDNFYNGKYAEQLPLNEYFYENDIGPIKGYVDDRNIVSDIAIYRYARSPDRFIILSQNEEISAFIEERAGWLAIDRKDKARWTIKYSVDIPCIYGNKKLQSRMELA